MHLKIENDKEKQQNTELMEKLANSNGDIRDVKKLIDANKPRTDIKLESLPKFHGNLGESFSNWLYLVDNYQKVNFIRDDQMVGRVLPLIRGHALDILIKFRKDNLAEKENWKMVKDYLLKMCEPKTKQRGINYWR